MEIESVSLMNMNTTASLPRYFTFNGVSFEKEEKPSLSDRKHPSSFKHDLTAGKVMQSSTNNSQKSNLEGFARMPTISQIKRESNIDSDLVKQETADYHEPDQKINHSQNEVENSQLFIKKEIFEEDLSEENGSKSQHDSEEESEKDQAQIKINMKQAKIDRTEAFNEIEMIRHSELNNIYNKIIGRKDIAFKAALRKTKKFYFVLIKRYKKYKDFMIGDSKNIILIFAACNELCNNSNIFSTYIFKYLKSKHENNEEPECKDFRREILKEKSNFTFNLPYFMMCFAFPTDIKKWVKDQQMNSETKNLISMNLSVVPEIILQTLDKFSMKNLHKLLSYSELDFLIKYYMGKRNLNFSVNTNAACEYLVKFQN